MPGQFVCKITNDRASAAAILGSYNISVMYTPRRKRRAATLIGFASAASCANRVRSKCHPEPFMRTTRIPSSTAALARLLIVVVAAVRYIVFVRDAFALLASSWLSGALYSHGTETRTIAANTGAAYLIRTPKTYCDIVENIYSTACTPINIRNGTRTWFIVRWHIIEKYSRIFRM